MELAATVISPIVAVIGKLMRFSSKFQVNNVTLKELEDILNELKQKILDLNTTINAQFQSALLRNDDTEYKRMLEQMEKKVIESIKKVKSYKQMNPFMRFVRSEHIKRMVLQLQEYILKLVSDLNQLELTKEIKLLQAQQCYTYNEVNKLQMFTQNEIYPMLLQIQEELRLLKLQQQSSYNKEEPEGMQYEVQSEVNYQSKFQTANSFFSLSSLQNSHSPLRQSLSPVSQKSSSHQFQDYYTSNNGTDKSQASQKSNNWHKLKQDKIQKSKQKPDQEARLHQKNLLKEMLNEPDSFKFRTIQSNIQSNINYEGDNYNEDELVYKELKPSKMLSSKLPLTLSNTAFDMPDQKQKFNSLARSNNFLNPDISYTSSDEDGDDKVETFKNNQFTNKFNDLAESQVMFSSNKEQSTKSDHNGIKDEMNYDVYADHCVDSSVLNQPNIMLDILDEKLQLHPLSNSHHHEFNYNDGFMVSFKPDHHLKPHHKQQPLKSNKL